MVLWSRLYGMVWLVFAQFILVFSPVRLSFFVDIHLLFGAAILALAHYNYRSLKRSDSPGRVKRIARIQAVLATVQPLLGIPLYLSYRIGFPIPLYDVVKVIHLIIALAIITQAASAATGFDMWEEKEFTAPSALH